MSRHHLNPEQRRDFYRRFTVAEGDDKAWRRICYLRTEGYALRLGKNKFRLTKKAYKAMDRGVLLPLTPDDYKAPKPPWEV